MKKRLLALLLAVCISASMLVLPASAAGNNTAVQFAVTLGAMDTTQTGALDQAVTRGAFARMLTSFSSFRESANAQGAVGTLFSDVPASSPWAPYIRIAVQQGWLNGYTDGSYRPDQAVTLEEACTAVLKLMGYKMTELSGPFPNAQLNKANEIGLRTGLELAQGETLNYEDCAVLLYNALTAKTASGGVYGTTLGFTVSGGQVDASSVLLSSLKGPFIAGEAEQLPFAPLNVYRNDKVSGSAELNKYDVYYYSESLQTLWVYTKRAAGRITAVSPSASAPTAVTVAGSSYTLGSTAVASQVSSLNGGGVGQVVTLLLGMNDEAAGIVTGAEADEVFYGIVQSASRSLVEENGADVLQKVSVICTDGIVRSVNVDKSLNFPTGWLVELRVDENGESLESITETSVSGTVNTEATALGRLALADDVEILDTTSGGAAGAIRPSRLSGVTLSDADVRYYTTNEAGEIDRLILKDVTGDLWKYGVLDDIKNLAANYSSIKTLVTTDTETGTTTTETTVDEEVLDLLMPTTSEILWGIISGDILSTAWNRLTGNTAGLLGIGFRQIGEITGTPWNKIFNFIGGGATYVCYINGQQTALSTSIKYPVLAGGIAVSQEVTGSVRSMFQLMPLKIDKVGAASVLSGSKRYEMADDAQVYLWYKGQYYPTKLASVNSDDYYLTGWYDNFGCTAGKKVRVIIAVKKN